MAKKQTNASTIINSLDIGNGKARGVSNCGDLVAFEPVIAPLTDKRGLATDEDVPQFALKVDRQTLVFGIEDVMKFGKVESQRRLNSMERYTDPDYFRMVYVTWLEMFRQFRGNSEPIVPSTILSVPISIYNKPETVHEIRESLIGRHKMTGYDDKPLLVDIQDKRLMILPESAGAMTHWAYDRSLKPRGATAGTTLVIDVGYETTDCSLFQGLAYQRERAYTIPRAGMGVVVRRVADALRKQLRSVNTSWLDRAIRSVAGVPIGQPKLVEVAPGKEVDIAPIYDPEIDNLSTYIANEVLTLYGEEFSRVLNGGGGEYHIKTMLAEKMGMNVYGVPDAELANVFGGLTFLQLKAQAGKA